MKRIKQLLLAVCFAAHVGLFADVSRDANGWTQISPSATTRIVYVSSSSGNDANDGLSPSTPKATIVAADALIRDGFPDHLLLKRGDTFTLPSGGLGRWKNGLNASEPLLLSYYGTSGSRPIVKISNTFVNHNGQARNYQAFVGLDIYKSNSDPDSEDFSNVSCSDGMRFVGAGANLLVEDCRLRFLSITLQSYEGTYTDAEIRRNIVLDTWAHNSFNADARIQGLFVSGVDGYLIEENFFDHCGWSETVPNAGANQYNHNIYVQYDNKAGGIMRGNILARGAAHGLQARSGGEVDQNLFVLNAVSLNIGGVAAPTDPNVLTWPNYAHDNVVLNGRLMSTVNSNPPRTAAVWGIWADTYIQNPAIDGNIVANRVDSGVNRSYNGVANMDFGTNVSYNWDPTLDTADPAWPHPDDDLGDYYASIGGTNSTLDYLQFIRNRPLRVLPYEMTAYAPINYIRAGFNMGAVEGYFDYDGIDATDTAPQITTDVLPPAEVNAPYYALLSAAGGNGTRQWDLVAGALPAGLTLNAAGAISGTPTAVGSSNITVRVADSDVHTGTDDEDTQVFEVTVTPPTNSVPVITTATLPVGTVNAPYTQTLTATGGNGALVWSLDAGTLPTGLSLSASGVISGTPTTTGTTNFTVRLADSDAQTGAADEDTQAFSLVIDEGAGGGGEEGNLLSVAGFEPDAATAIKEIPGSLYTVGTDQTDIWYLRSGTGSQQASFQDDGAGNHYVSVGSSANQPGVFQVIAWPGAGTAHVSYAYRGQGAIVHIYGANTGNTLNKFGSGNTLTPLQQINSPTSATWAFMEQDVTLSGTYEYLVVQLRTNYAGPCDYDNVALTTATSANSVPAITTETLPVGTVGAAYTQTLAATGGNGTLVWSLDSGTLPAGLNLSADGVLSGTPTTSGTSNFTVRVADSDAQTGAADEDTQALSLTIDAGAGGGSDLLSVGDFEPDAMTATKEIPGSLYTVGTDETGIWYLRSGTGSQQASFTDDGAGNHYVSVGSSGTQPGVFQVIVWPGAGTAHLSYAYRGQGSIVRIYGANAGNTVDKFGAGNTLTLLQQIDSPTSATWATMEQDVTLSGTYEYLVVQLKTSYVGVCDYDNVSLTMAGPANSVPAITTETLPAGTVGAAYEQTLTATGGDGTLAWSLDSGTLPAGLNLSADGVLSGTPTTSSTTNFTVRVADSDAQTGAADEDTQALSLTIDAGAGVGSNLLSVGDFEPDALTATKEIPGLLYTVGTDQTDIWYLRSGTGTQQAFFTDDGAGNHYVSVGSSGTQSGVFQVIVWPGAGTAHLNYAYRGQGSIVRIYGANTGNTVDKYGAGNTLTQIQQINSPTSATWTTMEQDVTLSGTYEYLVVQLKTNYLGVCDYDNVSLTMATSASSAPAITTETLPAGTVGAEYTQTLTATGGDGTLAWSLDSGTLPAGLNLSTDGVLSGTPTTSSTTNFTVRVADSDAQTGAADEDTQELSLTVDVGVANNIPSLETTSLPGGTVGAAYMHALSGSGGDGELVWNVQSGLLPPGLSLSATGVISGTPTALGINSVTIQLADSDDLTGASDEATRTFTIEMAPALAVDAAGWTQIPASPDTRVVYVSSSTGNDANDGLSPATARASITAGDALIRDGFPDRLLLKRGDTFTSNGLGRWKNGRSATEPIVLSYYGSSGDRPLIKLAGGFIDHNGQTRNFQVLKGLDFHKPTSDPASPEFSGSSATVALRFIGGGAGLLVEDCQFRFVSVVVQSLSGIYTNFQFRRNIVTDTWSNNSFTDGNARNQGMYVQDVGDGFLLEENVFDHNGWSETVAGAGANQFNHNLYINYNNAAGAIIRGNVFARGSAHGLQARSGGIIERNLFVQNAVSMNVGGVAAPTDPKVATFPNRATQNMIIEGRLMDPAGNNGSPRTTAVWGIWTAFINGVLVNDNIIANRVGSGNNSALNQDTPMTLLDNIVYEWDPNYNTSDPAWPHPTANLGDFYASLGGSDSTTLYLEWLRHRPVGELPWNMTAYAAINYLRAGFNKAAVDGYHTYDGIDGPESTPQIQTMSLPGARLDAPYQTFLSASGGNGTLTWSIVSGSLPAGLGFNAAGAITGTPTSLGSSTFTVRVADADAQTGASDEDTRTFTLEVINTVPQITSSLLPPAVAGEAYSFTFKASLGDGASVWSLDSGALPSGLTLNADGVVEGTTTTAGTYTFDVRVVDSDAITGPTDEDERTFTLTVNPAGSQTVYANSGATFVNTPIPVQTGTFTAVFDLQISGLIGANFGLSNGSVTGFSGMACILGVDSGGFFVARNGGTYSSVNFISYTPGVLYHFRFDVDVPTHTYSIYITPEGGSEVVLASNYAFRTEQAAVTQLNNQVITVATTGGWVSVSNFAILIGAPEITTTTLPSGTVDAAYTQALAATGGDGALVWSLASGSLPDGLGLSEDGEISGVPTTAGTSTFAVRVADSDVVTGADDEATQALSIVVDPAAAEVKLSDLSHVYDGTQHAVTVTTTPAGLNTTVTYDGNTDVPAAAGSYAVVATVTNPNYTGSANGTLVISRATATVLLHDLRQFYDGQLKSPTVTTQPDNLTVILAYDGQSQPPYLPGTYEVTATIYDANYSGATIGDLVITTTAVVRHGFTLDGAIDGSAQVLNAENVTLNGSSWLASDLLVAGTPTVRLNGSPVYGGTLDATGADSPSEHVVTLNGGVALRHVVRRVDPVDMPVVDAPPAPTGTVSVTLNKAGQKVSNWAALRNLTLNGGAGIRTIPAGTYGNFMANGSSGFVLGVAGATEPSVYNLQRLTLNGGSQLQIVGPVIVTLGNGLTVNGDVGDAEHPEWLRLRVANGGLTLNENVSFHGSVTAPAGTVILNVSSTLTGEIACDRLVINGNGLLEEPTP